MGGGWSGAQAGGGRRGERKSLSVSTPAKQPGTRVCGGDYVLGQDREAEAGGSWGFSQEPFCNHRSLALLTGRGWLAGHRLGQKKPTLPGAAVLQLKGDTPAPKGHPADSGPWAPLSGSPVRGEAVAPVLGVP